MAAVQDGKVIRAIQVDFLSVIKLYMVFFCYIFLIVLGIWPSDFYTNKDMHIYPY